MALTVSYADCATHGEQVKVKAYPDRRFRCVACYNECPPKQWPMSYARPIQSAEVRTIKVADYFGDKAGKKCTAVCTSGKRSCDCRCNGRCHGAGRCLGGHE